MTVWALSNAVFTTSVGFSKVKAFAIPNVIKGLKANSPYDLYVNKINMDWACQPFGGNLGDPLISDATGTLTFTWFFEQQYYQGIAVQGLNSSNTYLTMELRGQDNISSFYYLPVNLRGSQ
jgi:hypothetical protein